MRQYLLKRVLLFFPSILALILFCFLLLKAAPGDPLDHIIGAEGNSEIGNDASRARMSQRSGNALPVFYFSVQESKTYSWLPAIELHSDNQFDRWFFGHESNHGLIRGDLGRSLITNEKVSAMIAPAFLRSFLLVMLSLLLAYAVSIPAGIRMAVAPDSKLTKGVRVIFNILFALPVFWVALILLLILSNPYVLNILPSSGFGPVADQYGTLETIFRTIPYLLLPVFCYAYGSFAFVSSILADTMTGILKSDFIRTAKAKGLSEKVILRKHALRNALLPLITVFSHAFPAVIGGSVIIESIFSIPGMGLMIFQAIASKDIPVIIGVFFFAAIITMFTFLLSDLIYTYADPRIRFSKEAHA